MPPVIQDVLQQIGSYAPKLLGALGLLIGGWIAAHLCRMLVRGALRRTSIDNRLAQWMAGPGSVAIEEHAATTVFWIVMLFTFVAAFQALNLGVVTDPLNALLAQLAAFIPRLIGALLLLALAWAIATVLRRVVSGTLRVADVDRRLGGTGASTLVTDSLGEAVYWLVFLLFLPAILGTLALEGLLEPVQSLVDKLLVFLPNVFGAGLILLIGWFIAHLVRRIVSSLAISVGLDRAADRIGLDQALGPTKLSGLLGLIVYVLILIPALIAALDALALDAITAPASAMLSSTLAAIPALFGAALLLTIAYVVARLISDLVARVLRGAGFDNIPARLGLATMSTATQGPHPSAIAGTLLLTAVMLSASIEAARLLGFDALGELLTRFLLLGGQIVLGLIIFGVGLFLANLAAAAVRASNVQQAMRLALAARISIIVLAGAMALRQMGLASEIVNLAFGLLLGAIAVAVAIAFGLGARDSAGQAVDSWVRSLKDSQS